MQNFRVVFGFLLTLAVFLLSFVYLYSDFTIPREVLLTQLVNSSPIKNETGSIRQWPSWFLPQPRAAAKRKVLLLLWTTFFGETEWLSLEKCPGRNCAVTSNRSTLTDSTAVVFHWRDVSLNDLPSKKAKGQKWILYNMESPHHTPQNVIVELGDKIDIIISYRLDSDFASPYGLVRPKTTKEKESQKLTPGGGKAHNDKKLIAWLVSHCQTPSNREKYVEELKRYVAVDVYGKCGQTICESLDAFDCYQLLGNKYKFYLSFENSICKDYVTEKLFNALASDMVPVVFGGANYSAVLPPHSFIEALGFSKPLYLATYLKRVANNMSEYNSFLSWKKDYVVESGGAKLWSCKLCERLLQPKEQFQRRPLKRWWYDGADCRTWTNDRGVHPI